MIHPTNSGGGLQACIDVEIDAGMARSWTLLFEEFFRSEYPAVYRAAYLGVGSSEAAQDITQEAFARAFSRWRRLRDQPWAGGWVMTTALNLCRKYQKKETERVNDVGPAAQTRGPTEDRLDLSAALRNLPPRQRTATILFYLGDLSVPQIAHSMQISEGTVKAHLAQARTALRELLEVSDV